MELCTDASKEPITDKETPDKDISMSEEENEDIDDEDVGGEEDAGVDEDDDT